MAFRVKLDEDLSPLLASPLAIHGYSVATVLEQGWGGLPDDVLWMKVSAESIFFITADKGFSDVRAHPPGSHAGILVLRPARESVSAFIQLLEQVLKSHRLEDLAGTVSVASIGHLRTRRR